MRLVSAKLSRVLAVASLAATIATSFSQAIPAATAIPVVLTRSVAAGLSKPGDAVTARTLQVLLLPGGRMVPAGTTLAGHVVASTPFRFDATDYATQTPSMLSIHFDRIEERGSATPVNLSLRAIAGPVASHEAETPYGLDEIDWSATRTLIGGDTTSPLEKAVLSPHGSIVGYSRSQGIFARLLASVSASDPAVVCGANPAEQSMGVFSAGACGVYGLHGVALEGNGAGDHGTFTLESGERSVSLPAGTTALLEVLAR